MKILSSATFLNILNIGFPGRCGNNVRIALLTDLTCLITFLDSRNGRSYEFMLICASVRVSVRTAVNHLSRNLFINFFLKICIVIEI